MSQKFINQLYFLHLGISCNLKVFSGHLLLSLFQRLGAAPPDPHIWDRLLPEFRTSLLKILCTGLTALTSAKVLAHYNPSLPLQLAADTSAYRIGAVISHIFPDGTERRIAHASRILSCSEKNYAKLEKEALSLVFGIQKFHSFLYSHEYTKNP